MKWTIISLVILTMAVLLSSISIGAELAEKAFERPVMYGNSVQLYSKSNEVVSTLSVPTQIDVIYDWSEQYLLYTIATEDGFSEGILRIYDIQTGESKILSGYDVASATISPDQQKIAVVTYQTNSTELYLFEIQNMHSVVSIAEEVKPYSVEWNQNGDKLVYVIETTPNNPEADIEFATDIEFIDLINKKKERITYSGTADSPRWFSEQAIVFQDFGITKLYSLSTETTNETDSQIWATLKGKRMMSGLTQKPHFYCPYTSGEVWRVAQGFWDDPNSTCAKCCKQSYSNPSRYTCTENGTDMKTYSAYKRPYKTSCSSHCIGNRYAIDFSRSDAMGRDVRAAASGEVKIAKYSSSAGNYVTIKHLGGYVSRYLHNSSLEVAVNDKVIQGEKIAECGNTGFSTGAHIHFDVNLGSTKIPPEPLDDGYTRKTTPGIRTGQWLESHNDGESPEPSQTLTITKTGAGTVTGNGINCGSDCTEKYNPGTKVELTATPSANSSFIGWSGACRGKEECTLTMDGNKTVTAHFEAARHSSLAVFEDRLYQAIIRKNGQIETRYTLDGENWSAWDANGVAQGGVTMTVHDGKLYQAVIKSDGRMFTRFLTSGSWQWSGWEQDGVAQGQVALASYNGKLVESVIKEDGRIFTCFLNGQTCPSWEDKGVAQGNVALTEFNGKLYQTVVKDDGRVFDRRLDSTWSTWHEQEKPVPGNTTSSFTTIVYKGRLYQAALRASDGQIYTNFSSDGIQWSDWVANGVAQGKVSMAVYNDKLYQAVIKSDGRVFTRYTTDGGTWEDWVENGRAQGNVAMAVYNGKLYQSVIQDDDDVYIRTIDDGEETWNLQTEMAVYPTFAVFENRLYQTTIRKDGQIETRYTLDGDTWSNWEANGVAQGGVTMSVYDNKLYQAVIKSDGRVFTRFLSSDTWTWSNWRHDGNAQGSVALRVYDGKLFESVIKPDGRVFTRHTLADGSWPAWGGHNGEAQGNVALTVFDDVLYQSVVKADGRLFSRWFDDGKWSAWKEQGAVPHSGTLSMIAFNGRLYQSVLVATDGKIYTRSSLDGKAWGTSWQQSGVANGTVSMNVYNGRLYQSVVKADGRVFLRSTTDGESWSAWKRGQFDTAQGNVAMVEFQGTFYQSVLNLNHDVYIRTLDDTQWSSWSSDGGMAVVKTIASDGGVVAFPDRRASVTLPAGATAQPLTVSIEARGVGAASPPYEGFRLLGDVYDLTATDTDGESVTQFENRVDIALQYPPTQADETTAHHIIMHYYDENAAQWIALPSTVDTMNHTVTAVSDHFTPFALFVPIAEERETFLREEYQDVDKSLSNPDDDWMCWAAAAANILDWAGWGTPVFETAMDIFSNFQDHWTNAGGLMQYGWQWWFDGSSPENVPGWSTVNAGVSESESGGNYWTGYNFFEYFYEDWAVWDTSASENGWGSGTHLMETLEEYLRNDLGVTLAIYSGSGGHALTAWGYEYDEFGNYTGVYVTDSDDYVNELKLLTVELNDDLWYLDPENLYGYDDWFIGGLQALEVNPNKQTPAIPEPGTIVLVSLACVFLFFIKQRWNRR